MKLCFECSNMLLCLFPLSARFSLDVYNLKEDAAVFTGKRALISFLSWLDYCDQLIKEAQKVVFCCFFYYALIDMP